MNEQSSAIAAFTQQDISVVRAKSYKTHITKLLKRS